MCWVQQFTLQSLYGIINCVCGCILRYFFPRVRKWDSKNWFLVLFCFNFTTKIVPAPHSIHSHTFGLPLLHTSKYTLTHFWFPNYVFVVVLFSYIQLALFIFPAFSPHTHTHHSPWAWKLLLLLRTRKTGHTDHYYYYISFRTIKQREIVCIRIFAFVVSILICYFCCFFFDNFEWFLWGIMHMI